MERIDMTQYDMGSLHSLVFKKLEDAILDGSLIPGDALTELKLSSEMGVSRTPIREALRQLELEGLVRIVPNKGAVVIGLSSKDISDIYTIRMHIEGLATRWAAENITDSELLELANIVDLQEYYASKKDFEQIGNLDTKFHEVIYESCHSRPLKHTLSNFHHYLLKSRELSVKTGDRVLYTAMEHRRILEALSRHDPDDAERLANEHVKMAYDNLIKIG